MKTLILSSLLCIQSFLVYAQFSADFSPLNFEPADSTVLFNTLKERYNTDISAVSSHRYAKEITDVYNDRFEGLNAQIRNGHFVFDKDLSAYINTIYRELCAGNPLLLQHKVRFFVSRYAWANASCLGEGSIVINLGLLRRLENESQLAFVLAHEIAHYVLDHVNTRIEKHVSKINSKDFEQQLEKISKQEYQQNQKIESLIKGIAYESSRHSREYEASADSLAFVYLQKTKYNSLASVSALALLDEVDQEKYQETLPLQSVFDCEAYPFKKYWLEKESQGLVGGNYKDESWEQDSIKTHPDCKKRIGLIGKKLKNTAASAVRPDFVQPEAKFKEIVRLADFEIIEGEYYFGDHGKSLFHALQLLENYPDNAYLYSIIGKNWFYIYQAQKNHELGKFVDHPSKRQEDHYEEFLTFLHKLRLKDIKNINYCFLKKEESRFKENEDFLYALALATYMVEKTEELQQLTQLYRNTFPKGKHLNNINNLTN